MARHARGTTAPLEGWTEALLEALLPDEHDFQEFKSSGAVLRDGSLCSTFSMMLSKQVSAFANGSGGRLFLGIDDDGRIDGGIPRDLVSGGFRAWLEDVIPGSVDPPLRDFNVFEVAWPGPDVPTRMLRGHGVFVIDIPPSDDAPHQARDYRYYLRIAGKSRPMGNIHIQDVVRRTRTPRVELARIGPYGPPDRIETDPRGPKVEACFQVFLANTGRVLAQHLGLELVIPRHLVSREVRDRMLLGEDVQLTQTPGEIRFFKYHPTPLFPGQEAPILRTWIRLHSNNLPAVRAGAVGLGWRVYADDAPPREGSVRLARYAVVREALVWLDEALTA